MRTNPQFLRYAIAPGVLALGCLSAIACSSGTSETNPEPKPRGPVSFVQKPAPEAKTGTKVGEKAPDLGIKDQNGKKRELKEFLGKGKKTAIVFHRSIRW